MLAFILKRADSASVQRLSFIEYPRAIIRAVITVHVHTLDSHTFAVAGSDRPPVELGEIIPLGANRNTATAVVFEVLIAGIPTPLTHRFPHIVQFRVCFR